MNVIDSAKSLLENGHWTQGVASDPSGTYFCILGALGRASVYHWDIDSERVRHIMADVIIENYSDRLAKMGNQPVGGTSGIVHFNDHPDTTEEDVVSVLEKASVRFEEGI